MKSIFVSPYPPLWRKALPWQGGLIAAVICILFSMMMQQGWAAARLEQNDGAVYYVATTGNDSNPGTQSQPWLTIQKAINLAGPGDTITVRGGRYREALRLVKSGAPGRPIRLVAFEGEQPILDGGYSLPQGAIGNCNNTVSPPKCFTFEAMIRIIGSHIQVRGFEIMQSFGRGITIGDTINNPTKDVLVENCLIHDIRNNAVNVRFAEDIVVNNCTVYHGSDYATHERGTAVLNWPSMIIAIDAERVTFRNNTVHSNWGAGISAGDASSYVTIEDNTIYNNMGLQSYVHRARNVVLQRNLMYHTNDSSFRRGGDPSGCIGLNNEVEFDGAHVSDVLITHNILVGCSRNLALWNSERTTTPIENVQIINNTLVNAYSNSPRGAVNLSIACDAAVRNIRIEKNIIYQNNPIPPNNLCGNSTQSELTIAPSAADAGSDNKEQFIAQAPGGNGIVYQQNQWWPSRPSGMQSPNDVLSNPQLSNPDAALVGGRVNIEWYRPALASVPHVQRLGAFSMFERGIPPSTPTATPTAVSTPMPTPVPCTPLTASVLRNPSFEAGSSPWQFHTNGRGSYTVSGPGYECGQAAKLQIIKQGRNVQFFQKAVTLEPNTQYRLSFVAHSNRGHDLKVYLKKAGGRQTDYGLGSLRADLVDQWRLYRTEFVTAGFSRTVNDGLLQFWLAPYDADNDLYWIDKVVLEKVTDPVGQNESAITMGELIAEPDERLGTASVSGTVQLMTLAGAQASAPGATLLLQDVETGGFDYEDIVDTDEDGYYFFEGIPNAAYQLTVMTVPGYISPPTDLMQIAADEQLERVYTLAAAASVVYLPVVIND